MPLNVGSSPLLQSIGSQDRYGYEGLPPELAAEEQAINRKQQIANFLVQQGLQPAQGQMVGRFYVPPSPMQGVAGLAQVLAGVYGSHKADQARSGVADKNKSMLADVVSAYKQKIAPTQTPAQGPGAPVQTAQPGEGFTPQELAQPTALYGTQVDAFQKLFDSRSPAYFKEGPRPTTETPKTAEERQQAIVETLLASTHPQAQRMGKDMLNFEQSSSEREQQRDFLKSQQAENLAVRREGIASNEELRRAQIENTGLQTQALIDSRERQGMDTNELKKQAMAQQAELKKMDIQARQDALAQGKTPPGYRATKDGLEAIPGGPADLKLQGALNTDTAMMTGASAAFDRLSSSANQLLNHPGLAGITGLRGKIPNIPGSAAADAEAQLSTLKSQIGFGVMQELRNNSKSGSSGLGALSDAEGKRLEQNLAALDKAQSIEQMKSSLKQILDYSDGAKDRLRDAFNMKHKGASSPVVTPSTGKGPAVGTVDGGYRFKGGDPGKAESWEKQ